MDGERASKLLAIVTAIILKREGKPAKWKKLN